MKRGAWVVLIVVTLAVTGVLLWPPINPPASSPPPPKVAEPPSLSHSLVNAPSTEPLALRPHPQSLALADQLNAAGVDPAQDVIMRHRIITQYQRALQHRQGSPIGDDIDLARVLTGRNPMRQVFIPATHPALSSDGHLLDRWGTPYFLHPRGNGAFEVRSAGPDRKLFTADDLVANPPSARP